MSAAFKVLIRIRESLRSLTRGMGEHVAMSQGRRETELTD